MVSINYHCINQPAPKGTFGGTMCGCRKCAEKRYKDEQIRKKSFSYKLKKILDIIND